MLKKKTAKNVEEVVQWKTVFDNKASEKSFIDFNYIKNTFRVCC